MPKQFINRGDRLVFSNGVLVLAVFASVLIVVFDADLTKLIQLYLVGVFVSFTLSQLGMVVHWRKTREPGWKRSMIINAFGGMVTGIVFFVVVTTKFSHGAWVVVMATPIIILFMNSIHRHYQDVEQQLGRPERRPAERRAGHQNVVILVKELNAATARAIGYARSLRPRSLRAISLTGLFAGEWEMLAPEIELTVLPSAGSDADRVKSYLRSRRNDLGDDDFLTIVIPEMLQTRSLLEILRRPAQHRLKASLLSERGVQVVDVPVVKADVRPQKDWTHEPARNYAVVLVSGVHNAVLQAIEYAETLRPTDLRAVTFGLDPGEVEKLGDEWLEARVPHPLEVEDAPYRDIGGALTQYVRQFEPDGIERVVTVIIPEFVVPKKRHQILHGQTALIIKRHLLFEPGVVVASVPYHLERTGSSIKA